MDLRLQYGAKRLLVLSTFHIYGAHPANHIPLFEDEPLRASETFPQIADSVQLDNEALTWAYQHRSVRTVILRPTNAVGPHLHNAMSRFSRLRTVPYLVGFSPMMQFIHEDDLRDAVILAFLGEEVVSGSGVLSYHKALEIAGVQQIPVTEGMVELYLRVAGLFRPQFPKYLVDFFKFPCVIADDRFREDFGYEPKVGIVETLRDTVRDAGEGRQREPG